MTSTRFPFRALLLSLLAMMTIMRAVPLFTPPAPPTTNLQPMSKEDGQERSFRTIQMFLPSR